MAQYGINNTSVDTLIAYIRDIFLCKRPRSPTTFTI